MTFLKLLCTLLLIMLNANASVSGDYSKSNIKEHLKKIAEFAFKTEKIRLLPNRSLDFIRSQTYEYYYNQHVKETGISYEEHKAKKNKELDVAKEERINDLANNRDLLSNMHLLLADNVGIDTMVIKDHRAIVFSPKEGPVKNVIYYVHGGPGLIISNPAYIENFLVDVIKNIFSHSLFSIDRNFNVLSLISELSKLGYAVVCLNYPYMGYQDYKYNKDYRTPPEANVYVELDEGKFESGEMMYPYIKEQLEYIMPVLNNHYGLDPNTKNIYWGHSFGGELGHKLLLSDQTFMEERFEKIVLAMPTVNWPAGQIDRFAKEEERKYAKNKKEQIEQQFKEFSKVNVPIFFIAADQDTNVSDQEVIDQFNAFKEGQDKFKNGDICKLIQVHGHHGIYSPIKIVTDFVNDILLMFNYEVSEKIKVLLSDFEFESTMKLLNKYVINLPNKYVVARWIVMYSLKVKGELAESPEEYKEIFSNLSQDDMEKLQNFVTEPENIKSMQDYYEEIKKEYMNYEAFVDVAKEIVEGVVWP